MADKTKSAAPAQSQKAAKAATVAKVPEAPKITCYVGPSIYGALQSGTIYRGELPQIVKDTINKVPEIGALMVDISKLPQAQAELRDPRSGLSVLYTRAAKKAAERSL